MVSPFSLPPPLQVHYGSISYHDNQTNHSSLYTSTRTTHCCHACMARFGQKSSNIFPKFLQLKKTLTKNINSSKNIKTSCTLCLLSPLLYHSPVKKLFDPIFSTSGVLPPRWQHRERLHQVQPGSRPAGKSLKKKDGNEILTVR